MTNNKQLDHLIGVLYETVLDSSRWRKTIGLCGQYAGGVDTQLLTIDKKTNLPLSAILAETHFPEQGNVDYVNHYSTIDPRIKWLSQGSISEWRCCHEVDNQHFVDHNEFYQDFLIAYGARYVMGTRVDESNDNYSTLILLRAVGQQPFDQAEQLAASQFTGHLQRVLRLQSYTQSLQTKADLGARAIDALALSMLIIDGEGRILHLNAGAERLLNRQVGGLSCKDGRLSTAHSINKDRLKALVSTATGIPSVGGAMILGGEQNRQVFVTPLPAASHFARDWQTPLALVLVMETDKKFPTLQLLSTLYDFSPAELRVAAALLAGKSPEQHAQDSGVMINTVRSQLKRLFEKTNTHRQSELVALLSRAPPLQN